MILVSRIGAYGGLVQGASANLVTLGSCRGEIKGRGTGNSVPVETDRGFYEGSCGKRNWQRGATLIK